MSSAKWRQFHIGLNVLIRVIQFFLENVHTALLYFLLWLYNELLLVHVSTLVHVICSWFCSWMMTSANGTIFRVAGPLCGESTRHRWIPLTKASNAELWCFLWSAPEQTAEQTVDMRMIRDAMSLIMTSLIVMIVFFIHVLAVLEINDWYAHIVQLSCSPSWNSTQNISPIHWKMRNLLRAPKFASP